MSARLLVVDDEESMREVIVSMLSSQGYECTQAANGQEALAIFDSGQKFDLVISDIMMVPVDGIQLLQTLKGRYPALPVLIASPLHDKDVIKHTVELGACAYLQEPFEREDLFKAVQAALASAPSAGES